VPSIVLSNTYNNNSVENENFPEKKTPNNSQKTRPKRKNRISMMKTCAHQRKYLFRNILSATTETGKQINVNQNQYMPHQMKVPGGSKFIVVEVPVSN
jgi:hypothetical protein